MSVNFPHPILHSILLLNAHLFLRSLFFFMLRPPPLTTLFPYTTLFRSSWRPARRPRRRRPPGPWPRPCPAPRPSAPPSRPAGSSDGRPRPARPAGRRRSEEHTSELQSRGHLVCRLLLDKQKNAMNGS